MVHCDGRCFIERSREEEAEVNIVDALVVVIIIVMLDKDLISNYSVSGLCIFYVRMSSLVVGDAGSMHLVEGSRAQMSYSQW